MADESLHYKTITELAGLIESGELSPVEATSAQLERIEALDGELKSYATVMADSAMAQARSAEAEIAGGSYRGPLHGVPIAVKDLCFTTGVRTMGGTRVMADFRAGFRCHRGQPVRGGRRGAARQAQPHRGRHGRLQPRPGRAGEPLERRCLVRRFLQRFGRGGGCRLVLRLPRQRHGRFHPLPLRLLRRCGHQADLGPGEPLRRAGSGRIAGPCGADDPKHRRCGHRAAGDSRCRPQRSDVAGPMRFRTCSRASARALPGSGSVSTNDMPQKRSTLNLPKLCRIV